MIRIRIKDFFVLYFFIASFLFIYNKANSQTTNISDPYFTTVSVSSQNIGINNDNNNNCVDLTYDLFFGLSDKINDKSITKLQNYLFRAGYLKVNPNGYFGLATLNAVKNYQLANNINNTGRVGPQTRKIIRENSCINKNNTASVINSQIVSKNPVPNFVTRIDSSKLTIDIPYNDEILKTDEKIRIRWKDIKDSNYSLILEDKDGVSFGYINSSVINNSYEWTIARVYSSRSNSEIYVPPGQYRIYAKPTILSKNIPEQFSGLFTILGKPLEIDSIFPNTVSNNSDTSVLLYGKGFDGSTIVNYDVNNNGRKVKPDFISSDGKILVFKVSSFVRVGQYGITVTNEYDNGATSTPSNSVNLLIK